MGKVIPLPKTCPRTLKDLVEKVHQLAKKSEQVYLDHPHTQLRMREGKVTIRQVLDVLRNGKGIDGPKIDAYGDWRVKLKRFSAGRSVQVVVIVKPNHLEVVTVI